MRTSWSTAIQLGFSTRWNPWGRQDFRPNTALSNNDIFAIVSRSLPRFACSGGVNAALLPLRKLPPW